MLKWPLPFVQVAVKYKHVKLNTEVYYVIYSLGHGPNDLPKYDLDIVKIYVYLKWNADADGKYIWG